jgi:AmmeMemoRadiSam system protein A
MALTTEERELLLKSARHAIEARLNPGRGAPGPEPPPEALPEALRERRGAFVTLHKGTKLRGCIGTFSEDRPLYKVITEMAVSAAFEDPRFNPVKAAEFKAIWIEISALSPLTSITDIKEIEVGRHGICIAKRGCRGVLLPQVATEHGLDRDSFLDLTCEKAGLDKNAWQNGAHIMVFEAEIFREG